MYNSIAFTCKFVYYFFVLTESILSSVRNNVSVVKYGMDTLRLTKKTYGQLNKNAWIPRYVLKISLFTYSAPVHLNADYSIMNTKTSSLAVLCPVSEKECKDKCQNFCKF